MKKYSPLKQYFMEKNCENVSVFNEYIHTQKETNKSMPYSLNIVAS